MDTFQYGEWKKYATVHRSFASTSYLRLLDLVDLCRLCADQNLCSGRRVLVDAVGRSSPCAPDQRRGGVLGRQRRHLSSDADDENFQPTRLATLGRNLFPTDYQ